MSLNRELLLKPNLQSLQSHAGRAKLRLLQHQKKRLWKPLRAPMPKRINLWQSRGERVQKPPKRLSQWMNNLGATLRQVMWRPHRYANHAHVAQQSQLSMKLHRLVLLLQP